MKSRRGFLGVVLGCVSGELALLRGAVGTPPLLTSSNLTLTKFIADKRRQAEAFAKDPKLNPAKEVWEFFDAAAAGDRKTTAQLHDVLGSLDPIWQIVGEVNYAVQQLSQSDQRLARRFGEEILKAVPANAIYLGGTNEGRYLPTALSESHIEGRPFFVLTQHDFASRPYLRYILTMYGGKINVPNVDDLDKVDEEYRADARKRWEHDKANPGGPRQLKPGEDVQVVDGRVQVAGMIAVNQINARVAKLFFERNPNREFYVEESFPFDWMYPHLTPAGPIMKLNRAPVDIPVEAMEKDRQYWAGLCKEFLGLVVTEETTVGDIQRFVTRVELEKKLEGTDVAFVGNEQMRRAFSKLRSSQAGLYAWRLTKPNKHPLLEIQAEIAFKQAYAFHPKSAEALFRYVNLLLGTGRIEDALLVNTTKKLDPDNRSLRDLAVQLVRQMQKDFGSRFAGGAFVAAALMLSLGWLLLPVHIGTYFEPGVFTQIREHFHFWIWMYRVHIFGMITAVIALFAVAALVANSPARVLVWPGVAVASAGMIVGALAAAFYYHHGAWGALKLAGASPQLTQAFVDDLRVDTIRNLPRPIRSCLWRPWAGGLRLGRMALWYSPTLVRRLGRTHRSRRDGSDDGASRPPLLLHVGVLRSRPVDARDGRHALAFRNQS